MRRSMIEIKFSWLILGMMMLSVTAGCRKHDPPLLAAKNLGSEGQPLLPSPLPQYNQDILKGRATPVRLAPMKVRRTAARSPAPTAHSNPTARTPSC